MKKIKIISVSFENFKGFKEEEVLFDQYQAIILSGKNGFGKTTVFDAIELVFTGKINRYDSYLAFHRQNTSLSQHAVPLVYNNRIPQVRVAITLKIDKEVVVLYRQESSHAITNPIHFDRVFNELKIQYNKNGVLQDESYHGQFELDNFINSYCFLNYVSQEEATSFLKSKETDRDEQINKLFNTAKIDKQINKIILIDKKLNDTKRFYEKQLEVLTRELSEMDKGKEGNEVDYIRLVSQKEFDWDKENPQLSYEKFNSVLGENGILDSLAYYLSHHDDYSKWKKNKEIDTLVNSPLFPNFPYYLVLFLQQDRYKLYDSSFGSS